MNDIDKVLEDHKPKCQTKQIQHNHQKTYSVKHLKLVNILVKLNHLDWFPEFIIDILDLGNLIAQLSYVNQIGIER